MDKTPLEQEEQSGIVIDFDKLRKTNPASGEGILQESYESFGADIKQIMQRMFGMNGVPVSVTGSRSDMESFAKTLSAERHYIDAISRFGLDDPKTYASRGVLRRMVNEFERTTGVRFPFNV